MTTVIGGEALERALAQAEENVRAGRWPEPVEEADFEPSLHPRDRRGRWRRTVRLDDGLGASIDSILGGMSSDSQHDFQIYMGLAQIQDEAGGGEFRIDWRDEDDREYNDVLVKSFTTQDMHVASRAGGGAHVVKFAEVYSMRPHVDPPPPLPPVPTSDEVAKIQTPKDLNDYTEKKLGIPVDLDPQYGPMATAIPARFYQEIAQALTDAFERYPALKDGVEPLTGLLLASKLRHDHPDAKALDTSSTGRDVWAATGPDPLTTDMATFEQADGSPLPDRADLDSNVRWRTGKGNYILLNDYQYGTEANEGFYGVDDVAGNGVALADQVPYGRLMHELGHAVAGATGFSRQVEPRHFGHAEIDAMTKAGLTGPDRLRPVSEYGSTNPREAWAEIFTTLNTPGALDALRDKRPDTAAQVEKMRHTLYKGQAVL